MMTTRTVTAPELATPLLPFDRARELTRNLAQPLPVESVVVGVARQLVLAEDVRTVTDVPGFDNSAMDGYAVLARSTETAGDDTPYMLDESVRIATGHPLPDGCDAVVPWEATARIGNQVLLHTPFRSGQHVRLRGAEAKAGEMVLQRGMEITPLHIGMASALGRQTLQVHRRPRVAVASSGDEVAAPGSVLAGAQVYDSNRFLVQATVEAVGGGVVDSTWLPDDPEVVREWLVTVAASTDVIVTSGGASVGERDWIRHVVTEQADVVFWHVGVKPGKPIALAVLGNTLIFVLPGNPGATFACSQAFVAPAVTALRGGSFDAGCLHARLARDIEGDPRRTLLCPVRVSPDGIDPLPAGSSQLLTPYLDADALAVVPPGGAKSGDVVAALSIVK